MANLDAEAEYIAGDSPLAASHVVQAIIGAVERLKQYRALGCSGRAPGTRELMVPDTPYIVPYRIRGDVVEGLRVLHAARRWPTHL